MIATFWYWYLAITQWKITSSTFLNSTKISPPNPLKKFSPQTPPNLLQVRVKVIFLERWTFYVLQWFKEVYVIFLTSKRNDLSKNIFHKVLTSIMTNGKEMQVHQTEQSRSLRNAKICTEKLSNLNQNIQFWCTGKFWKRCHNVSRRKRIQPLGSVQFDVLEYFQFVTGKLVPE